MFLRLKNAMEELFGQHTAFVLALRQGFSAALLQLSILTAMHVCQHPDNLNKKQIWDILPFNFFTVISFLFLR